MLTVRVRMKGCAVHTRHTRNAKRIWHADEDILLDELLKKGYPWAKIAVEICNTFPMRLPCSGVQSRQRRQTHQHKERTNPNAVTSLHRHNRALLAQYHRHELALRQPPLPCSVPETTWMPWLTANSKKPFIRNNPAISNRLEKIGDIDMPSIYTMCVLKDVT